MAMDTFIVFAASYDTLGAAQRVMISTRVNPPRQVRPAKGWPWTSGRWS
jgi:hypothetical protein